MKRTPLLTIWSLSLASTILFANDMNVVFWLSFIVLCLTSAYLEKHSDRLGREKE